MGVRVLYDADEECAVLYCSTTGQPFGRFGFSGPEAKDEGECFLRYLELCEPAVVVTEGTGRERRTHDARAYTDDELDHAHTRWLAATRCRRCDHELDFAAMLGLESDSFTEACSGEVLRCDDCVADGSLSGARWRDARERYVESREDPWCYVRATGPEDARRFFGARKDAEVRDLGPWQSVMPSDDDEDDDEDESTIVRPRVYAVWVHQRTRPTVEPVALARSAS